MKSHKNNKTKISYSSWEPQFDEGVCSRSIWAYALFSSFLSHTKKIPRDIAARIDELLLTGETETSLSSTEVSLGASNLNPIGLPDFETIRKKQIPTLRHMPVKFRLSLSEQLSTDVSHNQTAQTTGRSYLPIVNVYYEHLIGVERNTNKIRKTFVKTV